MIEFIFWASYFFKTISFVSIIMFNGQSPAAKNIISGTFLIYFATQTLLTMLVSWGTLTDSSLNQNPFILAQLLMSVNSLLLCLWMIIAYALQHKKLIKSPSALSYFLIVVTWSVLIVVSTICMNSNTESSMENTIYILLIFSTFYGIGKFIPQFKLNYHSKTASGLCFSFLLCELFYFMFLGIFQTVNSNNLISLIIGITNVSIGCIIPLALIIQRKVYIKSQKKEELKVDLIQPEFEQRSEWEGKKGAASTTIYSSDSINLD